MKKLLPISLVALNMAIYSAAAYRDEYEQEGSLNTRYQLRGPLSFIFPNDSGYESVLSGGLQGIYWINDNIGFSTGFDLQNWRVAPYQQASGYSYSSGAPLNWKISPSGSAAIFQFNLSSVFRYEFNSKASVLTETGFRYATVSSDIDAIVSVSAYRNGYLDKWTRTYIVDIDNGALWYFNSEYCYEFGNGWGTFCGAGYQFDITKGKAYMNGEQTGENELGGFYIRSGVYINY